MKSGMKQKIASIRVGLVGSVRSCEEARRWDTTPNSSFGYITAHCILVSMKALNELAESERHTGKFS